MRNLVLSLGLLLLTACQQPETVTFSIVHTNDTHSQIEPTQSGGSQPYGGIVERASLIEMVRSQLDSTALYLDAGDIIQGTPYFNIFGGAIEVQGLNLQQLCATTLGNHEFDNGVAALDSMLRSATYQVVSCNYHCDSATLVGRLVPEVIVERHGIRIGITGVTTDPQGIIQEKNKEGIHYEDPVTAANRQAAHLRQQGCDMVILLSHCGYEENDSTGDRRLAAQTRGIDLIIGGHSHTNLERGVIVDNLDGRHVYITQTGSRCSPIGLIETRMRRQWGFPRCHYEVDTIICSKLHPEDYDLTAYGDTMRSLIAPYKAHIDSLMGQRIGKAEAELNAYRPQSPLGNFICDVMRHIGKRLCGQRIDASFINIGGLRNNLPAGNITLGTIYRIFPFENTVVTLDLKGHDLSDLIADLAPRNMEAMSGLSITLDSIEGKIAATQILMNGQPLVADSTYRLCVINYLAEGNDGFSVLKRATRVTDHGILMRDAVIQYIRQLTAEGRTVEATLDNRIVTPSH